MLSALRVALLGRRQPLAGLVAALLLAGVLLAFTPSPAQAVIPTFDLYYTFDQPYYLPGDTVTVTAHLDRSDGTPDENGVLIYPQADGFSGTANGYYPILQFNSMLIFEPSYLTYQSGKLSSTASSFRFNSVLIPYNNTYSRVSITYFCLGTMWYYPACLDYLTLKFTAQLPAGSDSVAVRRLFFDSSSNFLNLSQSAPAPVTPHPGTCIITDGTYTQFHSVTTQAQPLRGAGSAEADFLFSSGSAQGLIWSGQVAFTVTPEEGHTVFQVFYTDSGGDTPVPLQPDGSYLIPAGAVTEDTMITAVTGVSVPLNAFFIPTDADVTSSSLVYRQFSAYTGDKTLTLLNLPTDSGWYLDGILSGSTIYASTAYAGYPFVALLDWTASGISPTDASAQELLLRQCLVQGDQPCAQLAADNDCNGLPGAKLLDVQAAYDFSARSTLRWLAQDDLVIKSDVNRDCAVTNEDVTLLLKWAWPWPI